MFAGLEISVQPTRRWRRIQKHRQHNEDLQKGCGGYLGYRERKHRSGLKSLLPSWLTKGVQFEHGYRDSQTPSSDEAYRTFALIKLSVDF